MLICTKINLDVIVLLPWLDFDFVKEESKVKKLLFKEFRLRENDLHAFLYTYSIDIY